MWPFSRKNDDGSIVTDGEIEIEKIGCTAHHFGEYEPTSDHRVKVQEYAVYNGELFEYSYGIESRMGIPDADLEVARAYVIERKHKKKCQHHGCRETREKWDRHAILPPEEMESIGNEKEGFVEWVLENADSDA